MSDLKKTRKVDIEMLALYIDLSTSILNLLTVIIMVCLYLLN